MSSNLSKAPSGLNPASEALRKEWSDLEWKLRNQLGFAYAAGKVVRAILKEQQPPVMPARPVPGRPKPEPYPPFLADPRNRLQRNEFLATALEHGLVHEFGYHEVDFRFPRHLTREVVAMNHSL